MQQFFLLNSQYGFELTVNYRDFCADRRILFSFRIFTGSVEYPWFKYRWSVSWQGLMFELGHGKLQSAWVARSPLKKVAQP